MLIPEKDAATNCFVADDVDAAWDEIGRYLLHDAMAYSEWNPDNTVSANISTAKTVDELRHESTSHVILSVDEARKRLAAGEVFTRWDWFVDHDKWEQLLALIGLDPRGLTSQEYTINFLREGAVQS
jgi:hypothetical protein